MKINFTILITATLLVLNSLTGLSQNDRTNFCDHDHELYERVKTDPEFKREIDSVEAVQNSAIANYISNNSANRAGTIYYIPIVYHILHEGGSENISDAQVKSDLDDLNDIFRKRNANVGNVIPQFRGISADIEIEFRFAQKKNDGSCFSGITRTFNSSAANTGGNTAADAVKATHGDFPGNKYLNIYIVKSFGTSGAAGYTFRPGPPYQADMRNGIHVLNTYVGNIGTSTQQGFNTTIAHEAGHWFNLPHTWGNSNNPGLASNCNGDDGVADTPNTTGWRSCSLFGTSCGSLDNVENVMEYSYCSKMFTEGQKTRMRSALLSGVGGRNNLISAANQAATGVFTDIICKADIYTENTTVCQGNQVQYYDNSYHNATSWNWNFPGGTPSSSNIENPVVVYNNPGRHTVNLTVSNASGTKSVAKQRYIRVVSSWGASVPFSEGFETSEFQFEDNWENTSGDTSYWKLSNSSASGSKSAMLNNFNIINGATSELGSRTYNLSGMSSANLSFKYAYAQKSTTSGEVVQLLVSSDCGENWVIARGINQNTGSTDSDFFPTNWSNISYNINNSYFSANFRFKIRIVSGGGNNFFIDDINISSTVGVEETNFLSSATIYPNPMISNATLSLDLIKQSEVSVNLINALGQTVSVLSARKTLNEGNTTFEIQKNQLSKGVYFIQINVNGNMSMKKLIIN
jgi:PKD repeat protein